MKKHIENFYKHIQDSYRDFDKKNFDLEEINKIDSNYYIRPDNNSIRIRKENEDGHPTEKDCEDIVKIFNLWNKIIST